VQADGEGEVPEVSVLLFAISASSTGSTSTP
jgi:hypothetical protein